MISGYVARLTSDGSRMEAGGVGGDGCSNAMPGAGSRARIVLIDGDAEIGLGRVVGVRADLALVDALARLELAARRRGCVLRLREPCAELRAVLELAGLSELLIDD